MNPLPTSLREQHYGTWLWAHYSWINEIPLLLWYKDWKTLGYSEIMCRVRIKNWVVMRMRAPCEMGVDLS